MAQLRINTALISQLNDLLSTSKSVAILRWLQSHNLPNYYRDKSDLAVALGRHIEEELISFSELETELNLVDEVSGKVVLLRTIPNIDLLQNTDLVRQEITSRLPQARSQNRETIRDTDDWCLNYISIEADEIRIKFSEKHTDWRWVDYNIGYESYDLIKVIVVSINRQTGKTLLYFDSPARKHPHPNGTSYNEKHYYSHYLIRLHQIFPEIQEVVIFEAVYNMLNLNPRPVKIKRHISENAAKTTTEHRGFDISTDTVTWNDVVSTYYDKVHKRFNVSFIQEISNGILVDDVAVHLYPNDAKISFPSIILPDEVDYVISTITGV